MQVICHKCNMKFVTSRVQTNRRVLQKLFQGVQKGSNTNVGLIKKEMVVIFVKGRFSWDKHFLHLRFQR